MTTNSDANGTTTSSIDRQIPTTIASSHTLITPDFDLHYDLHGDPNGSSGKVLMVMGLLTDGAAWAFQVQHLIARGYQCVTYDNRGVGQSSTPKNIFSYTTKSMAQDAIRLVDHLGWNEFHVVGISMGGMIALELALALPPTRIISLTLMVTHAGGFGGLAPASGARHMIKSIFTKSNEARLDALLQMLYTPTTLADPELSAQLKSYHLQRMAKRIPPKLPAVLGHTLAVYRHYVSYTNLLKIRYAPFPTLVVAAEIDQLVRTSNSEMLTQVLGAKKVLIPNSGHGLLAEYPEPINKELEAHFLAAQLMVDGGLKRESQPIESELEEDAATDYSIQTQESLMGDGTLEQSAPYSLEIQALSLACSHSIHCSFHNIFGFVQGFLPAFVFRWIFYDSIALSSVPSVSRLEQSIRFGLLIGMGRSAWRCIKCILSTYRTRQWIYRHSLMIKQQESATRRNNNSQPNLRRTGIPPSQSRKTSIACSFR